MPFRDFARTVHDAWHNTLVVLSMGFRTLLQDPTIIAYPVFASLFFIITFPLANTLVISLWGKFSHFSWLNFLGGTEDIPHQLRVALGLVTFSYFYASVITVYFTCAISAAVNAKLEGHPTTFLHGLYIVWRKFWRVSHFAVLSIFFGPMAIYAQRKRLPKDIVWVVGSAFSIHSAQLAPAILEGHDGVGATIRNSIDTLGKAWHEGLVLKGLTYAVLIGLSALSFLPKLVERHIFTSGTSSHWAGWLASALLFTTFWVTTKVFGAVFATAIFHRVKKQPRHTN